MFIIYGSGNLGKRAYKEYGKYNVLLFIDKHKARAGVESAVFRRMRF